MKKWIILIFCIFSFIYSIKGQNAFTVKDGFLYTHIDLFSTITMSVESLIDTGCSLCVIDSTFARDSMGVEIMVKEKILVNTKKNKLPVCVIDSVKFCGKLYRKVYCLVANLKTTYQSYAPNFIVGADILRDRPLKFNKNSMKIETPTENKRKGGTIIKWKDRNGISDIPNEYIIFETKIQGQKYIFAFDTGSKGNKLPNGIQLEHSETIQRETADINHKLTIQKIKLYKNVKIQIGKLVFKLDFLEGKRNYGLLSLDLVDGHSFILDYKKRTLEILPF